MLTVEDLCRKGFYGMQIKDLAQNEINLLREIEGVCVVTEASVRLVEETQNPLLFVEDNSANSTSYVRANNKEFTQYVTNGRLNFNCPEYYFIFHELIVGGEPVSCNNMRVKLKIGAKSFFYFIKKLALAGIVRKIDNGSKILLCKDEPLVEKEVVDYPPPKNLLKNVPIYIQIRDLLTRPEGTSTQQIKEYLGIKNRQAHVALKYVMQEFGDEIKIITEFEGKTRRLRYILKTHYEQKEKQFESQIQESAGTGVSETRRDFVNTEQRTRVIEDLVEREKVVMYNKAFHEKISEILGSKHTIDKNTVVRTANASAKIDLVSVYIKYAMKTIARNVFKISSLEPTDPIVISCIRKEGYKSFSIVTNQGVVDYLYSDDIEEESFPGEKDPSERLDIHRRYYRTILFTDYENLFASQSNGYIVAKDSRLQFLKSHWQKACARIEKSHQTVDELPLSVLLAIFPFTEPNLCEKVSEFYREEKEDWKNVAYKDFRSVAGVNISKYFTSKKYLNALIEYIDDLIESNDLKEITDSSASTTYYTVVDVENKDSEKTETTLLENTFISKEEREEMYKTMCNALEQRIDISENDSVLAKHTAFGVGINTVMHSPHAKQAKSDIMGLFIRRRSFKKAYNLSTAVMKVSPSDYYLVCADGVAVNKKEFSKEEVLQCVHSIKTAVLQRQRVDVLGDLCEYDYFLLEYLILAMSTLKVLSLSKMSIRNNVISHIKITEEYRRTFDQAKMALKAATQSSRQSSRSSEGESSSTYLQTFGITGINKISPNAGMLSYTAGSLFLYLVHNGSACLDKILRKNFIIQAELENTIEKHPSLFVLHLKEKYTESIVMLAWCCSSSA
ncbi:hypothetical protein NEAUS03_1075 [Nematocida ausubeli]|nr:hypothetical protein NEAUS03_1075 [Nematocida ausubeli]